MHFEGNRTSAIRYRPYSIFHLSPGKIWIHFPEWKPERGGASAVIG